MQADGSSEQIKGTYLTQISEDGELVVLSGINQYSVRENISQKKQELQKAQEARQTVHANGSATARATRSHELPVATPVPAPAQTDTVTKPDMKRPATSPVIKNAEIKAGKETVRTNIRSI